MIGRIVGCKESWECGCEAEQIRFGSMRIEMEYVSWEG